MLFQITEHQTANGKSHSSVRPRLSQSNADETFKEGKEEVEGGEEAEKQEARR